MEKVHGFFILYTVYLSYFSLPRPYLHILLRVKKWEITITAIITTTAARERKRALKYAKRPRM